MTKEITVAQQVKDTLNRMGDQFTSILPKHVTTDKFIQVVNTAVLSDKNLLSKDRASLFKSCLELAAMGLVPDGKQAALVAFGPRVTSMVMISGILKLLRNSGEISTVMADVVYKNDAFDYSVNQDGVNFHHKPDHFGDRGGVVGVYAFAKLKDGSTYVEILTNDDIASIRKCSKGGNSGPWGTFANEMMKKSAIRRLAKRLPISTDIEKAVQADDKFYDVEKQPPTEVQNETAPKKSKLEAIVGVTEEPVQETKTFVEHANEVVPKAMEKMNNTIEAESKQTTPEVL